ncbi:hypothetical protein [Micromonospora halophytica]|uniref:hypothetical protein n=1 Tax=Micromonospora halophytica TaxID=47864 RepID=UPI001112D137|nr:hypothetical protein [Micromonospora halophytica]
MLADVNGLSYYPRVVDRADRRGIGVAATGAEGTSRDLLILHPHTGEVLAYEAAHATGSGWQVATYVLFLGHGHAARRWWEPPSPARPVPPLQRRLYPRPQQHWLQTSTQPCEIPPYPKPGARR